jgi:hypothetical protein
MEKVSVREMQTGFGGTLLEKQIFKKPKREFFKLN